MRTTTSTSEDSGAATGWSIADFRHFPFGTDWQASVNLLKISINEVLDAPDAPANLEATVGDGHVVLSLGRPLDDYINKYQYSTDDGASYTDIALRDIDSSETGKFKYTVENLTNGTTYTFEVHAVNSAGKGATSAKDVVMMPARPDGVHGHAARPAGRTFLGRSGQRHHNEISVQHRRRHDLRGHSRQRRFHQ